MATHLKGLAIRGYRGIGADIQKLAPFTRFNFFIGANNTGKSAVLNFLSDRLVDGTQYQAANSYFGQQSPKAFNPLDLYRGGISTKTEAGVALDRESFKQAVYDREEKLKGFYRPETIEKILSAFCDERDFVWFKLNLDKFGPRELLYQLDMLSLKALAPATEWQALWQVLNPQSYGGELQIHINDICQRFLNAQQFRFPECVLIPAIRQIGPKGEDLKDHSGRGLIDRLAELQNPSLDTRQARTLFDKINLFIQTVTDDNKALIEVPHNREHILVHMDGRVLPLESLGTGIHEVIMIAAFCTMNDDMIICIEEPEIHLHPLLQRKLIKYLSNSTDNQYFIATHSAAFIDTPGSAIFHVTKDNQQTRFQESLLRRDRLSICTDLGYRASDILQSNCVIWVEGPSDRIYIRWWISALAPEFIEGIHYSIMFYGGRLLSHLSANDDEVTEFINLRSINQHLAIVIDSDKEHARSGVNDTKRRILDEFNQKPGVAWLTRGREIENYINHDTLQAAVKEVYISSYVRASGGESFDHALYFFRKFKTKGEILFCDVDKVKVAKIIVAGIPDFSVLDLRKSIMSLVTMISEANS